MQILALGTVVEITTPGAGDRLQTVAPTLRQQLDDWGTQMYAYGDGELAQANAAFARAQCTSVSTRLAGLIRDAQRYERLHPGLFNAGLADLTRLWQLHEAGNDAQSDWQPPPKAGVLVQLESAPRALNLKLNHDQACPEGAVALDAGAFAKGRIIDELLDTLAGANIHNAIVNVGGDLKARGQGRGRAWRVAIRDPQGGALAGIELKDGEAVFTSGNYERFRDYQGRRYGHILDPVSGTPLTSIASVTVFGRHAADTDAAATALYVAASRARASHPKLTTLAPVENANHYVIVDTDGVVFVSKGLRERLQFQRPKTTQVHTHPAP
ncbi:MAG: FAD:protein FMN transferase [Gammaproteobacteria bacterium]